MQLLECFKPILSREFLSPVGDLAISRRQQRFNNGFYLLPEPSHAVDRVDSSHSLCVHRTNLYQACMDPNILSLRVDGGTMQSPVSTFHVD